MLNAEEYQIVKIERKDGVFTPEGGKEIPYRNYYVYFKREDSPLVMRAKVEKVFNDYVEVYDAAE